MKTQIIHLEAHDDFISARDKIGWSKASRILVLWPGDGSVLNRKLDLVLLKRHCGKLGAQLALVTRDPRVRYEANQLAIPVYKDLRKAQRSHWRVVRQKRKTTRRRYPKSRSSLSDLATLRDSIRPEVPAWQESLPARLVVFTLGVLALFTIAAVIFPAAQIKLSPQIRTQEIEFKVSANPELHTINLSGSVPAHPLSTTVQGSKSLESAGTISIPFKSATTTLQITNLSGEVVTIPAGTVVRTAGEPVQRFATTRSATVQAGPGERIAVPAQSIEPGTVGNLPSGSLNVLEGVLGTRLAVTNHTPATGGSNRSAPAPTANQMKQLHTELLDNLGETAIAALGQQLGNGDLLLPATLTVTQVLEQKFDPVEIQAADVLNLDLNLQMQAYIATGADLHALASAILNANLPAGFSPASGEIEIQHLTEPVIQDDGLPHWVIQASRPIQANIPEDEVSRSVSGIPPKQALQRLMSTLQLADPPYIELQPSWWPYMPFLPFRISTQVINNHR